MRNSKTLLYLLISIDETALYVITQYDFLSWDLQNFIYKNISSKDCYNKR